MSIQLLTCQKSVVLQKPYFRLKKVPVLLLFVQNKKDLWKQECRVTTACQNIFLVIFLSFVSEFTFPVISCDVPIPHDSYDAF